MQTTRIKVIKTNLILLICFTIKSIFLKLDKEKHFDYS